ncbi:MAG: SET domain-containing protein [Myxococcales bacterium]|nr:SET domain-containing protein [Myxococcales bacterium]
MAKHFEVRPSDIHGRGLFATRPIKAGAQLGVYEGVETKRNGKYVLWVVDEDGSEVGISGKNELRFLNHSSEPNCELDGVELSSLRDIEPGEELTLHYGDDWA